MWGCRSRFPWASGRIGSSRIDALPLRRIFGIIHGLMKNRRLLVVAVTVTVAAGVFAAEPAALPLAPRHRTVRHFVRTRHLDIRRNLKSTRPR